MKKNRIDKSLVIVREPDYICENSDKITKHPTDCVCWTFWIGLFIVIVIILSWVVILSFFLSLCA